MTIAFHRGMSHELRRRLQLAGIRLEEVDAQRALSGLLTREVDVRGNPIKSNENQNAVRSGFAKVVEKAVDDVIADRWQFMKEWEEEHPQEDPYPKSYPQLVIELLEFADPADIADLMVQVLKLAKMEMLFG